MMAHPVFAGFAFVLGAIVGSFLNACIYRMPRGIKLSEPKRSFCTSCERMIPWYENLPLVSWPLLRGKCGGCGAKFSIRYWGVEWLTAGLFLAVWLVFGLPLAPVYWLFLGLMVAATFIDFDFYIIPDEITIGGTVAGLLLSALLPSMMGEIEWWRGLLWSLAGAAFGFFILWGVVELGKLAFGKKRIALEAPEAFALRVTGDRAEFQLGEETTAWEEIFSRESDALVLEVDEAAMEVGVGGEDGVEAGPGTTERMRAGEVRLYYNRIVMGATETPVERVRALTGMARAVVIPREAMGFGDVKFIACIGAFLGWQAVAFTILASSMLGAVIGGTAMLVTRGKAGSRIPFGPYLALGAVLWLFVGPSVVEWYFGLFRPSLIP